MTIQPQHTSIAIPLSSLLPPPSSSSSSIPTDTLPNQTVILGPLPPSSVFHLALSYLSISDLPEYEYGLSHSHSSVTATKGKGKSRDEGEEGKYGSRRERGTGRVLIITGSKEVLHDAIEEEDEDWLRDHGGDYTVQNRLRRVDIRYCPTIQHLQLLLTVLTTSPSTSGSTKGNESQVYELKYAPGLIILWDVGGMMLEDVQNDENEPGPLVVTPGSKTFGDQYTISDYLGIIAATKSAVSQLSSGGTGTQLIILEPNVSSTSALPIDPTAPKSRPVPLVTGLRHLLAEGSIGEVKPLGDDSYTLSFLGGEHEMRRVRCPRGEWSVYKGEEVVDIPEGEAGEVEIGGGGDLGGWRWEWC